MDKPDGSNNNSNTSPSFKAGTDSKVELRMDEITSKFKNAFERMAELESLQLSMEQDADDEMKSKWLQNRERALQLHSTSKRSYSQDKEAISKSLSSVTTLGTVLTSAKVERLSPLIGITPVKGGHFEIEKDFETHLDSRQEVNEERGFPPEWSYEEQFKKLYDLGEEADRKDFLDKLFAFMQHRGTPVNRVPIMAKQTLDLYRLFKLVIERGGLVEVRILAILINVPLLFLI